MVDCRYTTLVFNQATQANSAWPSYIVLMYWAGVVHVGDGSGQLCSCASFIGFNPREFKGHRRRAVPHNGPWSVQNFSSSSVMFVVRFLSNSPSFLEILQDS